jgi:hypothetical protein
MGRRYSIDGQDTNTVDTTILGLTSAATIRPKIYDILMGSPAAPADNAAKYVLQRYTAPGTLSAVTPQALDPGDPASLAAGGKAHSVEPTYTANAIMLQWSLNQRATFRWVASPGGEIILPATANNGVGIQVLTVGGSSVVVTSCIHFEE